MDKNTETLLQTLRKNYRAYEEDTRSKMYKSFKEIIVTSIIDESRCGKTFSTINVTALFDYCKHKEYYAEKCKSENIKCEEERLHLANCACKNDDPHCALFLKISFDL